jgi:DNA-binding beta-propeller fold protein YncE
VKEFLSRRSVSFLERPIAEEDNLARLAARNPSLRTAPVTFVGDTEVVGWDPDALTNALANAGIGAAVTDEQSAYRELAPNASLPISSRWLLITSFVESAVAAIPLDGSDAHDLTYRTRAVPGCAIAAAHVRASDTIGVVSCDSGTVTWLRGADAAPLGDSLAASAVHVGENPLDVVADPRHPVAYVSVSDSRYVVVLDATTGAPAHGTLTDSSLPTIDQPGVMAFSSTRDELFVRQRGGGTLVFAGNDARSRPDRAEPRLLPTPPGRGIALADDERVLLAPQPFGEPQGLWIYDVEQSLASTDTAAAFVRTGEMPFGIAAHPKAPIAYVSCFRPPTLELRDARTGDYWTGSADGSVVTLPSAARAMVVDPVTDTMYVSCFDANVVLALDARTGAHRSPDSWATASGPRGMAVIERQIH